MKKIWYLLLTVLISIAYVVGQLVLKIEGFDAIITPAISLLAATAIFVELRSSERVAEAQLVMELNNQFISNPELTAVEWDLEKFYTKYKKGTLANSDYKKLMVKYSSKNKERQHLVNYLVHLEGIVALINENVIHLDTINDLMAYRYFIAVNNPVVQKLELLAYKEYYRGCFAIYDNWSKKLEAQGAQIPMVAHSLGHSRSMKKPVCCICKARAKQNRITSMQSHG